MNDYTAPDFSTTPVDGESAALLAAGGLELRMVDATDTDARRHWHLVTARGFHEAAQHLVLTLLTAGSQPDGTGRGGGRPNLDPISHSRRNGV